MEIGETDAVSIERIHSGGLEMWISVGAYVTVALIICQNDDYVRATRVDCGPNHQR